mgnify:CR=1 FL=1
MIAIIINLINVLDTGSDPELQSVFVSSPDLQTLEALLWPLHHGVQQAAGKIMLVWPFIMCLA